MGLQEGSTEFYQAVLINEQQDDPLRGCRSIYHNSN